jgi:glycosyltransferase involved in cell wall biosynthesis
MLNIHATNVTGLGAKRVVELLVPAISKYISIDTIYVPEKNDFEFESGTCKSYNRLLPNIISRFIEIFIFQFLYKSNHPMLVLGDVPLFGVSDQYLFVQTPHILKPSTFKISEFKFYITRFIFQFGQKYVKKFIVQTECMKSELIVSYPSLSERVFVLYQPVPSWLTKSSKNSFCFDVGKVDFELIYPAAYYPHKNHELLEYIEASCVSNILLTLDKDSIVLKHPSLSFLGTLNVSEMVRAYERADCLIFLSSKESFGFPLLEAMYLGLPIVCPNLPYANDLCGAEAFYFDIDDSGSIDAAIKDVFLKLKSGWLPNYSAQVAKIPHDWEELAKRFVGLLS